MLDLGVRGVEGDGLEGAVLESLEREGVAVAVPERHANTITSAREKDEEVSSQRIAAELRANDGDERIDALSPIDAITREEDERAAREGQQERVPWAMATTMSATRSGGVSSGSPMTTESTVSLIACDGRTRTATKASVVARCSARSLWRQYWMRLTEHPIESAKAARLRPDCDCRSRTSRASCSDHCCQRAT